MSADEHEGRYQQTLSLLAQFGDRSDVWRLTGHDAGGQLQDESLDFAYIDARHDYSSVREDIRDWWPKVKPGGLLAGHDYIDGKLPTGTYGVKSAVDEFFTERRLRVFHTWRDATTKSWFVLKPMR